MAISVPILGIIMPFVFKLPKKLQKYIEDGNYQLIDCTIVEVRNTMSDDVAIGTPVFNTGGKKVLIKTKDGKYCSNECWIDIDTINYFLEGNEPEVLLVNINNGYEYQLISKYKMKQI